MPYITELSAEAERDFITAPRLIQPALRRTLKRLEAEGPCLGTRLRGSGSVVCCRLEVRATRDPRWRIVYQWPPADRVAADEIHVLVIGTHSEDKNDVYRALTALLGKRGTEVGTWDAGEGPEPCCLPD